MFFILLCCYRPNLDYLQAQIDSIRGQTDSDFRCLVQDDASPAEWSERIRELCAGDARFSFRRNPSRLGVFHNFERGLYQTPEDAQYVCYCDQDDLWAPHKLERQRAVLSERQVMLCHTDLELIDGRGRSLHPSCFAFEGRDVTDYSLPQLILRNSVTGCTLAFKTALLPRLLPFPYQGAQPRFHHDHWTVLNAALAGRVVAIREALVRYRQHGGNVLGASAAASQLRPGLAQLLHLFRNPRAHLFALTSEWTRRREWIELLLQRAPPHPNPDARLDALYDWTQRATGSAYLFKFTAPHLFRKDDWLAPVALPVLLGKLSQGAGIALPVARQKRPPAARLARLAGGLVPTAQRDQLVRLANQPAEQLPPLLRTLGRRLWCRYREIKPLKQPLEGRQVCLFAHYDRDGLVDDYVIYHLSCLHAAGLSIIFVTTAPQLTVGAIDKLDPYCAATIERENIGLDFGSWRTILLLYPEILHCHSLLFANDSVYGPMRNLRTVIDQLAATRCDFWGITESLEGCSHYQSYFLGFHRGCLNSRPFIEYFHGIELLSNKHEIIRRYEIEMKSRLCSQGLRSAALIPARPGQLVTENPTLHRWREILAAGSPYLKVQLLRENPHRQAISDWPDIVGAYGYDPGLIERHLQRFRPV